MPLQQVLCLARIPSHVVELEEFGAGNGLLVVRWAGEVAALVEFPRAEGFLGGYESLERESLTIIVERRGKPRVTAIGVNRD